MKSIVLSHDATKENHFKKTFTTFTRKQFFMCFYFLRKSHLTKCILGHNWIRFQWLANSIFVHSSDPEDVLISFDNFGGCNNALFQIFSHHRPHNAACLTFFHDVVSNFCTTIISWRPPEKGYLFSSDSLKLNWSTWRSWFVYQWKNEKRLVLFKNLTDFKLLSFMQTK